MSGGRSTVTPLAEAVDVDVFGGKAAQLGAAIRCGLPVPGGYALSPDVVEAVVDGHPPAIAALAGVSDELGLVAVRSSAPDEDSAGASFAGAYLSVLGVSGADALAGAVRDVHRSGQLAGARSYQATLGLEAGSRMAVVVQQLVDADVAGVLFTRNPVTGADERVIEASWGLGEAVVGGLVTPDMYRVARGGTTLERRLGDKDIAIRLGRGGGDLTEEISVDPARAGTYCLGEAELAALDGLATQCDDVYGAHDHDIEFAFRGGGMFLLQRRPITHA
ncbi:PEP/pyruvate-binding domain-containing protein [Nocardioides astragali]|uniref:PEP/pyruvate-binding domain-containing protein n=1 Tax=Nocardioides astragali TaxID=1776736 RepID=A0ABW2N9I4_9ACTN|nr:PEP/pyruvate-binding domain-containing protein [Nocardioides astragali]